MAKPERSLTLPSREDASELARQWRTLRRTATFVALLTSPAVFLYLHEQKGWTTGWSIVGAVVAVAAFRGFIDLVLRRFIPWPTLFGVEDKTMRDEDVTSRRRIWFWRFWYRLVGFVIVLVTGVYLVRILLHGAGSTTWPGTAGDLWDMLGNGIRMAPQFLVLLVFFGLFNFLILFGPMAFMGISQIRGFATGFNSPFVSIPGSGFAQTFMGMDVVIVRYLARKARKLAAKWGGQCIVFIDEIDAVGMRRSSLGGAPVGAMRPPALEDLLFYGPSGALNPTGDMILETRAWRDRLFAERAPERRGPNPLLQRVANVVNVIAPGMMGGTGQLALNQLLIVMDGVDNPPFFRRVFTNKINQFLDAMYVIPQRIGNLRLRKKPPRPRKEEIYFIGACNVPLHVLDPALTRPGRMGRHIFFRTPTWEDRRDIFDLY